MSDMAPEYTYGGQWFDDIGAMVFSMKTSPALAFDIASVPGLPRSTAFGLTTLARGADIDPYADSEM